MTFASSLEANGQVMDRKRMKQWVEFPDDNGFRGPKWKARKIKDEFALKGDTLFCYSWEKKVPNKDSKQIYDAIRSWIKRTEKSNNFKILKENRDSAYISIKWNMYDIGHRTMGNIRYGISLAPFISFECRNQFIRLTFALDRYFVLKEYDRIGYIVDSSKDYRKWKLVWLIKDTYPYMTDSKLPKAAASNGIIAVYCSLKEMNHLVGQALGVTKARYKPESLF